MAIPAGSGLSSWISEQECHEEAERQGLSRAVTCRNRSLQEPLCITFVSLMLPGFPHLFVATKTCLKGSVQLPLACCAGQSWGAEDETRWCAYVLAF